MRPTDLWPSKPLSSIKEKPIAVGKFQEPVYRRGEYQNQTIEVDVEIYPISTKDPTTKKTLIGVRFGQMNIIRFVERDLVYNIKHLTLEEIKKK